MLYQLFIFLLFMPSVVFSSDQRSSQKASKQEGKDFSKQGISKEWKEIANFSAEDIQPSDAENITFNAEQAKIQIKESSVPSSEVYEFINDEKSWRNREDQLLDSNDYIFKKSNEISDNAQRYIEETVEETSEYQLEKCLEIGTPFSLTLIKKLDVHIEDHPEIRKIVNICQGHSDSEKFFFKSDAEKAERKIRNKLSSDPTIKYYDVWIKGGGWIEDYKVKSKWTHLDDTENCKKFKQENKKIKDAYFEEKDDWLNENAPHNLIDTPQCTFIKKECIEPDSNKVINGKSIFRRCWREKWSFLCRHDRKKGCGFLASKNCTLKNKHCLEEGELGCSLWELTFKCLVNTSRTFTKNGNQNPLNFDEELLTHYIPNTSFSNVCTTLTVFEAIKQEMEDSKLSDPTQIQVFKGNKNKCSKNIAADLMYDCCFSYKGLATDLKLTQCNSDELALAEMREKGLCYYVGEYEEKILNMFTSRKEHVFCCFTTKLSRVFQEQARQQLEIEWGKPKHPDCRGLSLDELSKVDFTKIDLSEAFEKLPNQSNYKDKNTDQDKIKEKCESLERRMKEQMQTFGNPHV